MLNYKFYLLVISILVCSLWAEARPFWDEEDDDRNEYETMLDSDYTSPSEWLKKWDTIKYVEPDSFDRWMYDDDEPKAGYSNLWFSLLK